MVSDMLVDFAVDMVLVVCSAIVLGKVEVEVTCAVDGSGGDSVVV